MKEVITIAELETPRTAAEILQWVEDAMRRFAKDKKVAAAAREGVVYFGGQALLDYRKSNQKSLMEGIGK